ncbi:146_t:CDS:2 [Acaulospora colombiana]|uniref:146_t:CDS:1 n=1 Tax=Acaulospora colombiana TaxID=27376 RepID=A0ACA9KKD6_9GLOM|nr:146_t:CDS:2 [Acaulospora colombiana]
MKGTGLISAEPVISVRPPDFENKHKNPMSSGRLCETHVEELNGFESSSSCSYEGEHDHIAEQRVTPIHTLNNLSGRDIIGASKVTKRFSGWLSSLWIPTNEDVADKDSEFTRFKKGLVDSCDKRSDSEVADQSTKDNSIWLLGVRYEVSDDHVSNELDEPSNYYYSTPGTFPHLSMQSQILTPSDYPTEFYQDFTSRIWWQSLLANALILQFLGRDWRRTRKGEATWEKYVEVNLKMLLACTITPRNDCHTIDIILTWFIDDMSSRCPFSVHRMAILGKQLGKNIGEWFGPSTASQAIKALVEDFPPAQLRVYETTDAVVYKNEIYKSGKGNFRSVLILVPIRLGINNLNPIYYDALKSVGIAGYVMVKFEKLLERIIGYSFKFKINLEASLPHPIILLEHKVADDLFYLDPHYSRPAVELKDVDEFSEEISKKYKPIFTIAQEAPVYKDEDYDMDVLSGDEEFEEFERDENAGQVDDVDDAD